MLFNRQEKGIGNETESNFVENFIKELGEKLLKMQETLVVDRIEGNIAVCENRDTGKMQDILIENLPKGVKEGTILKYKNGKYEIDKSNEIEDRIEKKMKDVWK